MPAYRLDDVRLLLAEPKMDVRRDLEQALRERGFRQIIATGNMLPIRQAIEEGGVDLLIGDTTLPEGDLSDLIYDMRHGKIGDDPFLVTITLVSNPDNAMVRRVVDSGTDTVLLKPFSADDLVERVFQLVELRKKFVVTTDYIGPDRRQKRRPGTMQVPLVQVPNPLRDRVFGQTDPRRRKRAVDAATARINEEKVERHAYQIKWLVERILPPLYSKEIDDETRVHINRLIDVSADMAKRVKTTRFLHVSAMCTNVHQMASNFRDNPESVDDEDLRLIGQLPDLIWRAFETDRQAGAAGQGEGAGA